MKTHLAVRTTYLAALVAAACGLWLGTPAARAQGSAITVQDAWVREPLGDRKETAAYAVVANSGRTPRAIVSAVANVAGKVELHETKMMGAKMQMSPVTRIEVPAGGKVELKPGGFHLMLFEFKRPLKAGDTVGLTLTFDDGTSVSLTAPIRKQEETK